MNSQNHPLNKWQFRAVVATAALCLIGSAAWSQTSATVSVNAASVIAAVPTEGYGVNAAIYDADVISSSLPSAFEAAGITAVRYPGGSYSDCFHWQTTTGTPAAGTGYPGCSIYITSGATFQNFMTTDVNPAGAHAIVTVNYGSNTAGTGGGQPSEAAAWVQYANITNGWGVKYWEIGNEVGGNGYFGDPGWEFDLHYPYNGNRTGQSALSPASYAQNTLAYISAMKAVDPTIKIGIGVWCPDTNNINPQMFNVLASKIDFLIVHWYPGSSALSSEATIASAVANIRNEIAAAGGNYNIPFAITETNADNTLSPAADAVWNVDNYFTWFENGAVNVDYWELFGGFMSSPTQPLDPYYAVQFSNTVARVGDNLVTTSSSNSLLRTHAVKRSDGSVAVLLLNEDSSNSDTVSVSISGATVSSSGTKYTLNASSGTTSSSISGIGNSFSVAVPANSAIGILIPPGSGSCTPTPIVPYISVAGVWSGESTATVTSGTVVDLGPQPINGGSWSWVGPNGFTSTARELDGIALSTGTNVYTATYTNSSGCNSTQTFTITVTGSSTLIANGTYIITGNGSGLAIDDPAYSGTGGTDLDIYTANDGTNQQWTVNNLGNNVITLTNVFSGQLVDVAGASTGSGALIDQWPANGQKNQQWNVISVGNGIYELTSVNSGLALSVVGGGTSNGTGLEQLTYSGSTSQQWKFTAY